jgi:hypothetical protein
MTDQHPIPSPPPELVQQWDGHGKSRNDAAQILATQAAQWGADQELEACCEWFLSTFGGHASWVDELRAARRPKPASLKEQALAALGWLSIEPCLINGVDVNAAVRAKYDTIRKALEALPND